MPPSTATPTTPLPDFDRDVLPLVPDLERAARRYAGNHHDAQDLLQETLTKAWLHLHRFQPGTNLRAWLFRILVNTWISAHRKTERRPAETLVDVLDDAAAPSGAAHPSAEDEALHRLCDPRLARAFADLAPALRAAVYYADVRQLSHREIAELEGIPVGTVMSRTHRGRHLLRAALAAA